jgi:hypothetical protein
LEPALTLHAIPSFLQIKSRRHALENQNDATKIAEKKGWTVPLRTTEINKTHPFSPQKYKEVDESAWFCCCSDIAVQYVVLATRLILSVFFP